jgi:hypothetical protein
MGINKTMKITYIIPPNYHPVLVWENTPSIPQIGDAFYYTNVYHIYTAYSLAFFRRGISAYRNLNL